MSVTQRLMKPGDFTLKLTDNCPRSIADAIAEFDHIVITPNQLQPISGFSDANILAAAIYTGVVLDRTTPDTTRRQVGGAGLGHWFGTEDGFGDLLDTAVSRTSGTLSQWASDLCPSSLAVGTITNTGVSAVTNTYQWVTRREAFDAVCRAGGAEWRINPNGTLDAALPSTLFASTPKVFISRKREGFEGTLQGLEGRDLETQSDVRNYATKVIVLAEGNGTAVATGSATGSTSYKDLRGNTVVMERLVNAPSEKSANATAVATAELAKLNAVRREITLSSRTYTVGRFVQPGDYVWVWDQLAGISDQANQVMHRGELTSPMKLRVYALTWPIARGQGVYVRSGATGAYTDLTPYVEWENGNVRWEVGAATRPLTKTTSAVGSVAYLGTNPEVVDRFASVGGYVTSASITSNSATATTVADVSGLSVTWTAQAGRRYQIVANGDWYDNTSGDLLVMYLTDSSNNVIRRCTWRVAAADSYGHFELSAFVTPAAGSVTYKVRQERNTGTGNSSIPASSTSPATIAVFDIGPA